MHERLTALRRLNAVYQMVEEMHSIEARRAASKVVEAQGAIHAEEARIHEARTGGREALLKEDHAGWSMAVVHEEITDQRKKQLESILEMREKRSEVARKRYLESRLWSERMKSLTKDASARVAAEEERRVQSVADDQFLARRRWRQKVQEITHKDMNVS